MFDITKYYTFEDVDYWLDEASQHSDSDALVYLVGNMIDLEDKREVKRLEAETYADSKGFHGFYEVSAKSGENVNQYSLLRFFTQLAQTLYNRQAQASTKLKYNPSMKLTRTDKETRKGPDRKCCK